MATGGPNRPSRISGITRQVSTDNRNTPPYWHLNRRRASSSSVATVTVQTVAHRAPIALEDHTEECSESCGPLWVKQVTVDDYVVITGNAVGGGAHVEWNCTVEVLDGEPLKIKKRYSDFHELRHKLVKLFPHAEGAMPPLPPKSVISNYKPKFLEKRRAGLGYFLNCILLNPEFAGSPVLKEFVIR